MKRWIAWTVIMVMLITVWPVSAFGEASEGQSRSGTCGAEGEASKVTWELDGDGVLTISGEGSTMDWTENDPSPWSGRTEIGKVVVADGVTGIGNYAFEGCSGITEVQMSDSVERIGKYAFSVCKKLETVKLRYGLTTIGECAFERSGLTSLRMPASIRQIGQSAFMHCKLKKLVMPNAEVSLGSYVFAFNTEIRTAGPIGSGCDYEYGWKSTIPAYAFSNLGNLKTLVVADGIQTIEESACQECTGLDSVWLPSSLTTVKNYAFHIQKTFGLHIFYGGDETQWEKIRITNRGNVVLKNGVYHYISVPDALNAEAGKPVSVTVRLNSGTVKPENLEWSVDEDDLLTMENLKTEKDADSGEWVITFMVRPLSADSCHGTVWLKLPDYRITVPVRVRFGVIASDSCGPDLMYYLFENGTLVIEGSGDMDPGYLTAADQYAMLVRNIVVQDGVESIGEYALSNFPEARYITLPDTVERIGEFAFDGDQSLLYLEIPKFVREIPEGAFLRCYRLTSVKLPRDIRRIAPDAFERDASGTYYGGSLTDVYYSGSEREWERIEKARALFTLTKLHFNVPETQDCSYTKEFIWNIINTDSPNTFGDSREGFFILGSHYDTLISNLKKEEENAITKDRKRFAKDLLTYNVDGQSEASDVVPCTGSCYGFAVTGFLAAMGLLDLNQIQRDVDCLYDIDFHGYVESRINYYFWQQKLPALIKMQKDYRKKSQAVQLRELEALAEQCNGGAGTPVLLCYKWKEQDDEEAKNQERAHALLAYGAKTLDQEISFDIMHHTYAFNHVIYLYDNGCLFTDETAYQRHLYYNDEGVWAIPGRNIVSTDHNMYKNSETNNGRLDFVTVDPDAINAIDYDGNVHVGRTLEKVMNAFLNQIHTLTVNGATAVFENGTIVDDGGLDLCPITPFCEDSDQYAASIVLPDAEEYVVTTGEEPVSLSMYGGDCWLAVSADAPGTVSLGSEKRLTLQSDTASVFSLEIVSSESPLSWDTVRLEGVKAKGVTLEVTEQGIVVESEEPEEMTIYTEKGKESRSLTFTPHENRVLIRDEQSIPTIDRESRIREPITVAFSLKSETPKVYDGSAVPLGGQFQSASAGDVPVSYIFHGTVYRSLEALSEEIRVSDAGSYPVTAIAENEDFYGQKTVEFTIRRADPQIRAESILYYYDGGEVPESVIQGTAEASGRPVPGTWSFSDPEKRYSQVEDSGMISVTFTPVDTNNYNMAVTEVMLEIQEKPVPHEEICVCRHFTDINHDPFFWYHEALDYVVTNEMMKGTGDTTFAPNTELTRAMIAQILYNMEGAPEVSGHGIFTDVKDEHWFAKAVNWAAENGLVNGFNDGSFGPGQYLTREQSAAILQRYAEYRKFDISAAGDLSLFSDRNQISGWAEKNVRWAVGTGLLTGMGDGTLNPGGTATRAQVAVLMMRFRKLYAF